MTEQWTCSDGFINAGHSFGCISSGDDCPSRSFAHLRHLGNPEQREAFEDIFKVIADEYDRTRKLVLEIEQSLLRPMNLQLSVDLQPRIVPELQVALLRRLRDQNRQPP